MHKMHENLTLQFNSSGVWSRSHLRK